MSRAVRDRLNIAGRHLQEARKMLPAHPEPGTPEHIVAHRIDDIIPRLVKALDTWEDERMRRREQDIETQRRNRRLDK